MTARRISQATEAICDQIDRLSLLAGPHAGAMLDRIAAHCHRSTAAAPSNSALESSLAAASKAWGVPVEAIIGRSHCQSISLARHTVYLLMHDHYRASLNAIGGAMGRNFTAVRSGIRRIQGLMDIDGVVRRRVQQATEELR